MLIPAEQVVLPGLERALALIGELAAAWDSLNQHSPFIDPQPWRRPMDAPEAGEIDAVLAARSALVSRGVHLTAGMNRYPRKRVEALVVDQEISERGQNGSTYRNRLITIQLLASSTPC